MQGRKYNIIKGNNGSNPEPRKKYDSAVIGVCKNSCAGVTTHMK
jgi:hypothetical protein